MSEYPWDLENLMLGQHDQPCDCAICDEIWWARENRRQKRKGQLNVNERMSEMQNEISKLKTQLKASELIREHAFIESGLLSERKRNELLVKEIEELKAEVKQVTQTAENFHDSWSSLKDENAELRGINQSLSVDWVKFNDMKSCLEFFARLHQDMLIVDINQRAKKALHMGAL